MADNQKEELLSSFDILRTEYIKLLNDKDVLLNWGKPQLEALYSVKIGVYQVQLLQMQLNIQALKRKLEMARSLTARGMPLDVNAIELIVAEELAEAEMQIMEQAGKIASDKELLSNLESPQRSAELRSLFRQLAKSLHPDVNPELTPEQVQLWNTVKQAYKSGDIEKLKALKIVYDKELNKFDLKIAELSEEDLSLRLEVLKEGIKVLNDEIIKIKDSFPFDMEDKIKDENWVKSEKENIEMEIAKLRSLERELILEYESIINNYGGSKPELN